MRSVSGMFRDQQGGGWAGSGAGGESERREDDGKGHLGLGDNCEDFAFLSLSKTSNYFWVLSRVGWTHLGFGGVCGFSVEDPLWGGRGDQCSVLGKR